MTDPQLKSPPVRRRWMNLGFRLASPLVSGDLASRLLRREAARIVALVRSYPRDQRHRKADISRNAGAVTDSPGLSVAMILAHMAMANDLMADIVTRLAGGQALPGELLFDELPFPEDAGDEALPAFQRSVEDYLAAVDRLSRLRSRGSYGHPWFGPLDAHQWHCVAAGHHYLHRLQLRRLLDRLPSNDPEKKSG